MKRRGLNVSARNVENGTWSSSTGAVKAHPENTAKSAKAVLKILMKITNIDINLSALEEKAKEIQQIAQQLKEIESSSIEKTEDLKYIG